jgi:DNA processing protein
MSKSQSKNQQENLFFGLSLKKTPGIGDTLAKTLISYCGSAEAVFKETKNNLQKIPGMGKKTVDSIKGFKDFGLIEDELKWVNDNGVRAIFYLDKEYPYRLKDCADAPICLFVKGGADLNNKKCISVVGTRLATHYGREFCYHLGKSLSNTGALIISGLAHGIDSFAHKEALQNVLPTAAVLGHGLKHMAPPRNKNLSERIVEANGALITEHFSDDAPAPENFPKRNRIVAGMCDALVIVESGIRGGAMITAELAWSYNRELFSLPGRVGDTFSQGCNHLIASNKAMCIESSDKLIDYLGWKNNDVNKEKSVVIDLDSLSDLEKRVYNFMRSGEKKMDDMHYETGIPLGNLSMILLDLEFKGIVKALPGNMFKLSFA